MDLNAVNFLECFWAILIVKFLSKKKSLERWHWKQFDEIFNYKNVAWVSFDILVISQLPLFNASNNEEEMEPSEGDNFKDVI